MTARVAERRSSILLRLVVTAVIASVTLTWVPVMSVGGFDLRLPYMMALILGALLCLHPTQLATGINSLLRMILPWLAAYVLYLIVLQVNLAGGATKGMVFRQVFFLTCGLTLAVGISGIRADARVLRWGGMLAIFGFFAFTEFLARQIGLSWTTTLVHFLSTGDLGFVFYHFLREMFQMVAPEGVDVPASNKNIVAACMFIAMVLMRAGYTGRGADRIGGFVTLVTLLTLVIFNTRSVLLMAAVGIPFAAWIGLVCRGVRSPGEFYVKSSIIILSALALILVLSAGSAAMDEVAARLSFEDQSTEGRLNQYAWAFSLIEQSPLVGSGLVELNGQNVHNLFIGAWLHAGLAAFLLVVIAYLGLLLSWLLFVFRLVAAPGNWVLPVRAEWVAILPLMPLFRVWVAGDAGHPGFGEWIAFGAFFGLVLANRRARGRDRAFVLTPIYRMAHS
ncbi:hypothetical protein J7426_01665 [Tropicibacter sp. R16_0]|uniref:O-antigen ligase family protein n=1 Tax=Tropicibacter sp. R16_0 TaxID=2821102 RepID=UPI001ADABEA3|nr:O-antigen ligase family protein [Tropicibacter sp. R16_0]MBO9448945.1 hypothetical protein [Tropicibacter sp. R16_0]